MIIIRISYQLEVTKAGEQQNDKYMELEDGGNVTLHYDNLVTLCSTTGTTLCTLCTTISTTLKYTWIFQLKSK